MPNGDDSTPDDGKPTTILVLTTGAYSDFRIIGVFSEDRADDVETMSRLLPHGGVEKYKLNEKNIVDPGMDYYVVVITREGKAKVDCWAEERLDGEGEPWPEFVKLRTNKDFTCGTNEPYWQLVQQGYAKSEEHACRSASELRRQILAGQRPQSVDLGKN